MSQENVDVVRRAISAYNRRDLEALKEVNDPDVGFIERADTVVVPNSARLVGRDGVETTARSAIVFRVLDGRVATIRLHQTLPEPDDVGIEE